MLAEVRVSPRRLLVGCKHAKNCVAILAHWVGLQASRGPSES